MVSAPLTPFTGLLVDYVGMRTIFSIYISKLLLSVYFEYLFPCSSFILGFYGLSSMLLGDSWLGSHRSWTLPL